MKPYTSLILAALVLLPSVPPRAATNRNVLLIVADDYGVDSSPLYNSTNNGARLPPTPNIASLASNGVLFRRAYAYPTCSPTRSCMFTGRYGFRTGIGRAIDTDAGETSLPAAEFTLPDALAASPQQGYRHASFGKWHLGQTNWTDPNVLGGWSHYAGGFQGDLSSFTNWLKTVDGTNALSTAYATSDNATDALDWIAAQGTNRWFVWLAFNAPHKPFHKPPDHLHGYDALSGTTADINTNARAYYEAMIEAMDTEIGRVVSNINLSATTVLFVGDNGTDQDVIQPPFSANRAKGTLYDGGIHVPLVIAGAGVNNPGRESSALVHCVDLHSTILALAGVSTQTLPAHLDFDSQSLVPLLAGTNAPAGPRIVLSEYFAIGSDPTVAGRAVLGERYKLIQFRSGTNEFYDRDTDPQELTNLLAGALSPQQQTAYNLLSAQSDEWQARPVLAQTIASNLHTISFTPVQFYTYARQRSSDLLQTNWTALAVTSAPSSDVPVTMVSPLGPATNVITRLRVVMP